MNYIFAIIAGLVQGLTEFLPISSSGHLVLLHDILKFSLPDDLAFDVMLHLGTALALVLFFRTDLVEYVKAFFTSLKTKPSAFSSTQWLAWYLIIATIPAALAGYYFEEIISGLLRNVQVVAWMLIAGGVLLYLADRFCTKQRDISTLTIPQVLAIGCAQALALIPGVSRSGITIIAGLASGLHREAAARFSFLLAIPIMVAAGGKELADIFSTNVDVFNAQLLIGFVTAAITGFLCITFFLRFLQKHSLAFFAYYRIALGVIILMYLYA